MKNKTATISKQISHLLILLLLFALMIIVLSSCGDEHTHVYGEWSVVSQADCTHSGKRVRYCTCGKQQEEVIAANGEHNYTETIVKAATGTATGTKKLTCTSCGFSKTEEYSAQRLTSEEIYALAEKTVVEILTYDKNGDGIALGSGFVIGTDGRIVTNYHVIDEAYSIKITLGTKKYNVTDVLAYDEDIDLAILKIDATLPNSVTLNKDLQPGGSPAYAVGSSEGYTLSFSSGSIASPDRVFSGVHYIQHSSPISHGNSGGPLFNAFGEVVGINTSTDIEGQNLNFAIVVSELDNLPQNNSMTMKEFYKKEGPYFDIFIGDYVISEKESNNTQSTAQAITINGTTVDGSINKESDRDIYKVVLGSGTTLSVLMVPDLAIDNEGILCGLCDSNLNAITVATETTLSGTSLQYLTYSNTSSTSETLYILMFYSSSYRYKNTVANYNIFFYAKADD